MVDSAKPHHYYYEEEEEDLFFTKKERKFIIFILLSISICITYSLYITPSPTNVDLSGAFEPLKSAAGSTEMENKSKTKANKKAEAKEPPPPHIPVPSFSWDTFEQKEQMSRHSYPLEQVPGQSLTASSPLGLKNIGNTCFMNAILQMLFHLEPFRAFVIDTLPPQEDDTELVVGLKRLFTELRDNSSKQSFLIPSTFHHRLSLFTENDHIERRSDVLMKYDQDCADFDEENVPRPDLDFEDLSDFRMHDSSELLNVLINRLQTVLGTSCEGRFLESNLFTHLKEVKQCPRGQNCPNKDSVQRIISPQIPIIPKFPNNPKKDVIDRLEDFDFKKELKPKQEENFIIRSWRWLTGTTNRDALNQYYSDCMLLRNLERMDVESVVLGSRPARINFAIQEGRRKLLFSYSALTRHSALPAIPVRGGGNDCESTEGLLQSLTELVSGDPLWRYPLPSENDGFDDFDDDDMTKEKFQKTLSSVIAAEKGKQLPPPHPEPRRSDEPISIEHLMAEHFRAEYVVADCGSGCAERISVKKNYFVGSQIMIVSLSRVELSSSSGRTLKIDNAVTFREVLDMSAYADADEEEEEEEEVAGARYRSGIYNLQSVVVHGGGANGGHYWSYAKSGDQWYQLNDASVSKVQFSSIGGQVAQLGYVYSE